MTRNAEISRFFRPSIACSQNGVALRLPPHSTRPHNFATRALNIQQPTTYQSTSRRPIARIFRLTATNATEYCVRHAVSPDAISCFSVFAAGLAAVCLWKSGQYPLFLLFAPAFLYLR